MAFEEGDHIYIADLPPTHRYYGEVYEIAYNCTDNPSIEFLKIISSPLPDRLGVTGSMETQRCVLYAPTNKRAKRYLRRSSYG
jgi:hypothetical protein